MKQPLWKCLLSYFVEFHIESAPSQHNPHLYVSLSRRRYQLCTQNTIYSFAELYDNFSEAFKKIDLEAIAAQEVLILGFGLGSVPLMLEKNFGKQYHYTAVELDESVVYLASKYTLPDLHSPVELVIANAGPYVEQCRRQFDLIAMDIFLDDVIPEQFEQISFLQQLQRLLTPTGLLMYNRLALSKLDVKKSRKFYDDKFKKAFPKASFLEVKGNWMLLSNSDYLC